MSKGVVTTSGITLIGICLGVLINITTNHHPAPQQTNAAAVIPTKMLTPTIKITLVPTLTPTPTIKPTLIPAPTNKPSPTPSPTFMPTPTPVITGSISCVDMQRFTQQYCH